MARVATALVLSGCDRTRGAEAARGRRRTGSRRGFAKAALLVVGRHQRRHCDLGGERAEVAGGRMCVVLRAVGDAACAGAVLACAVT